MSTVARKTRARKTVITLKVVDGQLDVRVDFFPTANTTGPMPPDVAAAMSALEAIQLWAKGGAA